MALNNKEKLVAASMLEEASSSLGNKRCNDWDFPDSWTHIEKLEFVKDYHEYNGDPEEFDVRYLRLPDFAVASFLAHKLRNNE